MVGFFRYIKLLLTSYLSTLVSKSFTVKGRSSINEFRTFFLGFIILIAALQLILNIIFTPQSHFSLIILAGLHLPAVISLVARRLHDIGEGWAGWWAFIYIIPIVGLPILIAILFFYPTNKNLNKYGPPYNN